MPTPPLSLASSSEGKTREAVPQNVTHILRTAVSEDVADNVEAAAKAAVSLRKATPKRPDLGVRIWSGPSADRPEICSSRMPSISESPLEQDFTIEGVPSRLGCPFASMANKNLSSHAANVLSRYKSGSMGGGASHAGSASRIDGRESSSRRGSRRASFLDPIKAEICGLSDHQDEVTEPVRSEHAVEESGEKQDGAEPGVCPIRFLDQHSPEEVATYFERHKHELPRSHEICVRRYQSNEQQIRELDEKYGNLVSMISGLGAKHKNMLPTDPDDDDEVAVEDEQDTKEAEKVRKWASSVSAQPADAAHIDENAEDDRQQRFDRPLRDIRVGESPSRPWGISVPTKYLEKAGSEASTRPAQVASPPIGTSAQQPTKLKAEPASKCPFGFDQTKPESPSKAPGAQAVPDAGVEEEEAAVHAKADSHDERRRARQDNPRIVVNGPVFFGYSADDAAKILRDSGFGGQM